MSDAEAIFWIVFFSIALAGMITAAWIRHAG